MTIIFVSISKVLSCSRIFRSGPGRFEIHSRLVCRFQCSLHKLCKICKSKKNHRCLEILNRLRFTESKEHSQSWPHNQSCRLFYLKYAGHKCLVDFHHSSRKLTTSSFIGPAWLISVFICSYSILLTPNTTQSPLNPVQLGMIVNPPESCFRDRNIVSWIPFQHLYQQIEWMKWFIQIKIYK